MMRYKTEFVKGQWPENITKGMITYTPDVDRFILRDASHGIPVFGNIFNYPSQAENIARRLVACWNYVHFMNVTTETLEGAIEALLKKRQEKRKNENAKDSVQVRNEADQHHKGDANT